MTSAISTTSSQTTEPAIAFATLRVTGDELAPGEITKILKILPTKAYAKGEHYAGGPRRDLIGRTGMWLFSTKGVVASDILTDHLAFLARLLLPGSGEVGPLPSLTTNGAAQVAESVTQLLLAWPVRREETVGPTLDHRIAEADPGRDRD